MSLRSLFAAVALTVVASDAHAQLTPFDPREYQSVLAEPATEVLVLGTPHLTAAPAAFTPNMLEPLLKRLLAFRPTIIAVEALPGENLSMLDDWRAIYGDSADQFAAGTLTLAKQAQATLDLDMPAAEAEVRARLARPVASPAERRRLIALFVAAGDTASARVQWLKLPPDERRADDSLSQAVVDGLTRRDRSRNEVEIIAVRLAHDLDLQRLYPMDDHAADDLMLPRMEAFAALFERPDFKALLESDDFKTLTGALQRARGPDETLALYRDLNSPEIGRMDAALQWRIMIDRPLPDGLGRIRMAEWEARNLRMAANIREAAVAAPGARILVIVGAAHKPWLDAYLGMMIDMNVVDAETVLR